MGDEDSLNSHWPSIKRNLCLLYIKLKANSLSVETQSIIRKVIAKLET